MQGGIIVSDVDLSKYYTPQPIYQYCLWMRQIQLSQKMCKRWILVTSLITNHPYQPTYTPTFPCMQGGNMQNPTSRWRRDGRDTTYGPCYRNFPISHSRCISFPFPFTSLGGTAAVRSFLTTTNRPWDSGTGNYFIPGGTNVWCVMVRPQFITIKYSSKVKRGNTVLGALTS